MSDILFCPSKFVKRIRLMHFLYNSAFLHQVISNNISLRHVVQCLDQQGVYKVTNATKKQFHQTR